MTQHPTTFSVRNQMIAAAAMALFCAPLPAAAQSQPVTQAPVRAKPAVRPQPPAVQTVATHPPQSAPATTAVGSRGASAASGEVIARMGVTEIREEDLRAFVSGLSAGDQAALRRDPEAVGRVVRALLANQLVLMEAQTKHWDLQPEIARQLTQLRDNAIVQTYLQAVSAPPQEFPSEADLQSAYDANKSAFLTPRQYLVAQIFIAAPKDADKATDDKAKARIAEIARQLKQPNADFAAIARANSDAKQTAERGGEIGWLAEPQLRPEIKAQVMGLAKGAVSDPIRLEDGWQLVKLTDTKPATTPAFAEVHDALKQRMRDERAAELRRTYLADLLKQNPPAINEIALSKVLVEPSQAATR